MKIYTLYVHIAPNGKMYFGITCKSIKERWGTNGGGYNSQLFSRAIKKYGWDNFKHIVLLENLSKEMACECEKYLIAKFQTNNPKYGYNVTAGGDGTLGHTLTPEAIEKMRKANLGKHLSEAHKQKISQSEKGKKLSDEHKKKISEANRGRVFSDEHRTKLSLSHKGYKMPEEQKDKIRQSLLGREFSEEWRNNISKARKGTHLKTTREPMSEEQKKKISEANKRRWAEAKAKNPNYSRCNNDETRKKLSDAGKKGGLMSAGRQSSIETRRKISESLKKRWDIRKGVIVNE